MKRTIFTFMALILATLDVTQAQVITNVPPTTGNDRFLDEIYTSMKRPGLSVIGFDNAGNHSKGYGLKQILNQVYVTGSNTQKELFKNIIDFSIDNDINPNPQSEDDYADNSNILQYRAFEALCSYILFKNGITPAISNQTYGIPIRDHQTVLQSFTTDIMALIYRNNGTGSLAVPFNDYVKHTDVYGNIARAIDLYLALENAYKHFDLAEWNNLNSTLLLAEYEKEDLNRRFLMNVYSLQQKIQSNIAFGVNEDEVEPGNRPLKGYMAMGYGALAGQKEQGHSEWDLVDGYPGLARIRGSSPTSSDRMKKWMYQSDNGKRTWAEGPYYLNYALLDVIPFWHAIRANNMLNGVSDPFISSWFLNPVEWMADISTPDGLTPPLDDGNKHRISAAPLLRWSTGYSNNSQGGTVGKKFNTIFNTTNNYFQTTGSSTYSFGSNTWLLELSIPTATSSMVIDYDVHGTDDQQFITRFTDASGRLHYLLLNGENGNSISRGEGHEQPDQLQLLYYIDGESYLMDSGYDGPKTGGGIWDYITGDDFTRSTWNNYKDHNVTQVYSRWQDRDNVFPDPHPNFLGGIDHPEREGTRAVSDHQSVNELTYENAASNLSIIHGEIDLISTNANGSRGHWAEYRRHVLLVKDRNYPYIIDINSANTPHNGLALFYTTYHGNSNDLPTNLETTINKAIWMDIDGVSEQHLALFPDVVEGTLMYHSNDNDTYYSDTIEEKFRDTQSIKRLNVFGSTEFGNTFYGWVNTSVAFIKPIFGISRSTVLATPSLTSPPDKYYDQELGEDLKQQAYIWDIDSNTKDVLIVRGAQHYRGGNANSITISVENTELILNTGKDFGFARLV
ncbi:MAG: hypothetical protein AAFW89_04415, partial [Bacteroidota bacterium]